MHAIRKPTRESAYFMTMLLLVLHEIDAAYWHEWDMFGLPGGIQGFLLFNALVIPVLLLGYRSIVTERETASTWGMCCGVLGVLTVVIHSVFLLAGTEQFTLPFSLFILVGCLIFSLLLLGINWRSP